MKRTSLLRTLPLVLAVALLAGCSKEEPSPVQPPDNNNSTTVTIKVEPSTATAFVGDTVKLTATVTGSTNTGVNWSISPAIGTITEKGEYIAPSSITGTSVTVTVKAAAKADANKSATSTITVEGPPFTATMPGAGSSYLESTYRTDSVGNQIDGSEGNIITNVEAAPGPFQGYQNVTTYIHSGGEITYLRHDRTGDVWLGQSTATDENGNVFWHRLPFGSKKDQGAILSTTGNFTLRYDAVFAGEEEITVNATTLKVYKVRLTTIANRTGTDARITTIVTELAFAPSIGWFGKRDEVLTRVDSDGMFRDGRVSRLTNYTIK